jgi:AcrR family transcriptional regulator
MATREEKKALTRKKLLDAAAALVAKEGAMAASLDAIAEKAGLTKGAVYSNFSGKEELIDALADRGGPNLDLESVWDDALSLADNLEACGRAAAHEIRTVSRRAWQLGIELHHYAMRDARMRRQYAAGLRSGFTQASAFFAEAIAAEGVTTALSPGELHVTLNALALGLAQQRAIDPDLVPDELFAKTFRLLAAPAA